MFKNYLRMASEEGGEIEYHTEYILTSNKKYAEIDERVRKTYPKSCIVSIEEIFNPFLLERYEQKRQKMIKEIGKYEELELFHGTGSDRIDSISRNGFLKRLNVVSAFGKGNYFSPNASYSFTYMKSNEFELSYMFLCNCLIGKTSTNKHSLECDTVLNRSENPDIYCIKSDDAIYPRYIIKFHMYAK